MTRILKHDLLLTAANERIAFLGSFGLCIDEWCDAMQSMFKYMIDAQADRRRRTKVRTDPAYAARRKATNDLYESSPKRKVLKKIASRIRVKRMRKAVPPWADYDAIEAIYAQRDAKPDPQTWHVDHIIPLIAKHPVTREHIACGLHVQDNLQVITEVANRQKNCWFDPDEYEKTYGTHTTTATDDNA